MATLPTNYVDEVLDESMDGKRHYNMTTDSHGTYFTDVTEYDQRGSTFGAAQINEITTQVNSNTSALGDVANKLDKTGDSKDNTVTYTSGDSTSPGSFQSINVMASGEKHSSLFNKLSKAVANIRWLNSNKRTTGAFDSKSDTVTFTTGDSATDSAATSWSTVSQLVSGLTHATLLNRISTMMKNTRYLYNISTSYTSYSFKSFFDLRTGSILMARDNGALSNVEFIKSGRFAFFQAMVPVSVISTTTGSPGDYILSFKTFNRPIGTIAFPVNIWGASGYIFKPSEQKSGNFCIEGYADGVGGVRIGATDAKVFQGNEITIIISCCYILQSL